MGCAKIVLLVAALAVISAVRAQEASTDLGTGLLEKLTDSEEDLFNYNGAGQVVRSG